MLDLRQNHLSSRLGVVAMYQSTPQQYN